MKNERLGKYLRDPRRSRLMDLLRIKWVCFDDIGGWIFQDHPFSDSLPQEDVLEFIRQRTTLWGTASQYIAANTPGDAEYNKDMRILVENDVFGYLGVPNLDDHFDRHFIDCDGAADKGNHVLRIVRDVQEGGVKPGCCAFDNSLVALKSMPMWVYCFGNELKDKDLPQVSDWYQSQPKNLYEFSSFGEIVPIIAHIHLAKLRYEMERLPDGSGRKRLAKAYFPLEVERVAHIFKGYDLTEVLNRFRQ